jgi:hypothetical protein
MECIMYSVLCIIVPSFVCFVTILYCPISCYSSWDHSVAGCFYTLWYVRRVGQWLRLALSKGPNTVGAFQLSYEDGNRSNFRNDVFSSFQNSRRWTKPRIPVILSAIYHRQNPLAPTNVWFLLIMCGSSAAACEYLPFAVALSCINWQI